MALPAGYHCTKRPHRRNPRRFTPKDLARISRRMEGEGHTKLAILAAVMVSLGFGAGMCKVARSFTNFRNLFRFIKEVTAINAAALSIRLLIEWMKGGQIAKVPVLNRVVVVLVVVLLVVEGVILVAGSMVKDASTLYNFIQFVNKVCEAVDDAVEKGVEAASDATEDFAEWADEHFEDLKDFTADEIDKWR